MTGVRPDETFLDPARLLRAKPAYTTRFAAEAIRREPHGHRLVRVAPRAGDIVLARVESIGHHTRLESPHGRRAWMFVGDEILVAYGNRYAPDQFEAEVPGDLDRAHLVAAGGMASRMITCHASMSRPTVLRPLGLLSDGAGMLTLPRFAPFGADPSARVRAIRPSVIAVVGSSMNSGKTTTAAALVRGLSAAGRRVVSGKVTGTGAGGDPWLFHDSGSSRVLDFTDFGYASTYLLSHAEVRALFLSMIDELSAGDPDVLVLEIADGLFQREVQPLIADAAFAASVDHLVFSCGEVLGAVAGVSALRLAGLSPVFVSGVMTASPLAVREAAEAVSVPVLDIEALSDASVAGRLGLAVAAAPLADAV